MTGIAKKKSDALVEFEKKQLKVIEPDEFKEFLSGLIVHLMELNLQTLPEPGVVSKFTDQLYGMLRTSWAGATRDQVYRTCMHGMSKQAQYGNFKVNYPLISNWLIYHKQMTVPGSEREKQLAPTLNEQARIFLAGLSEYRKRKGGGDDGG